MAGKVDIACRCCGVPVNGPRQKFRVCPLCDQCDGMHGNALERLLRKLAATGAITMWHGIGRMAVDNAHLTGRLSLIGPSDAATMWVATAPRPWEVVLGRAGASFTIPDIGEIVAACLAPFIPGKVSRATMDAIGRELTGALTWVDPNVVSVDVDCKRDSIDPEHLLIHVNTRTNVAPGSITVCEPNIEIPDDILSRPRGQA